MAEYVNLEVTRDVDILDGGKIMQCYHSCLRSCAVSSAYLPHQLQVNASSAQLDACSRSEELC